MTELSQDETSIDERRSKLRTRETSALIALAVTVLLQMFAGIWWAATLSADVRYLTAKQADQDRERYTKSDADRDNSRIRDQLDEIKRRIGLLESAQPVPIRPPTNGR